MKTYRNFMPRLRRFPKAGAVLGMTLLAASALQAQNPAGQSQASQLPLNQDPATQSRTLPQEPGVVASSTIVSHRAKVFLREAAQANLTEIAMANAADGKSENTEVKGLAQMVRGDCQINYAQLLIVAQACGVSPDNSPDWLNQREVNHLQAANPVDFDRDYAKAILKEHVKSIQRFEKASADVVEMQVNKYAQNSLSTLRRELRRSEEVARDIGVDESTITAILRGLSGESQEVTVR
jgi:putative membrane protein